MLLLYIKSLDASFCRDTICRTYKWVESSRGSGLFDLSLDIGEQYDLSKEKPDILSMVKSRFAAWEKRMAEVEPRGPFRNF